ncbi:MAG: membrane protein insertase YidC [Alphaproteobacteria bacterium]|nr:membrane protein insertase YidC [Alphaproteobacteria bacterium]
MNKTDNSKNLIMAIALSLLVLVGYQYFLAPERPPQETTPIEQTGQATGTRPVLGTGETAIVPGPDGAIFDVPGPDGGEVRTRDEALNGSRTRLALAGSRLAGSINLSDGRFDDITLVDYRETLEPDSPLISMFSPTGSPNPYFAEFGWVDQTGRARATGNVGWQTSARDLAPGRPVELSWTDPEGLVFTRIVEIDQDYLFTITDRVENRSSETVTLAPFGRIFRANKPEIKSRYILHVGPIGVIGDTLEEVNYKDLVEDGPVAFENATGWLGITDKFWLAALIPSAETGPFDAKFSHFQSQGADRYQVDFLGQGTELAPGASTQSTTRLFVGAKEVSVLTRYMNEYGFERFDMAIDFGWFFFLTKPLLSVLVYFADMLGNFGLSILLITVIIKLIFFPLANKSYASMSKMKALQPKIVELREQYSNDKQRMQTELMALYKREKANPVSGCLPIVLQIPVFFALYKVLFVSIEMRHAPFFGWIHDLSAPDPTTIANLFGLIPWAPPEFLMLGAWPLIMGISMFAQMKLNPAPPDPVQAKVFMLMPFMFMIFLAGFPAGLVIYWSWNNILSMAQQYVIMRRMGVAIGGGTTKASTKAPTKT